MKTLEYRYQLPRFSERVAIGIHINSLSFRERLKKMLARLQRKVQPVNVLRRLKSNARSDTPEKRSCGIWRFSMRSFQTDRGIEIVFEADIPKIVLAQSLVMDRVTRGRRQALLN